jgi:hypothetical protein
MVNEGMETENGSDERFFVGFRHTVPKIMRYWAFPARFAVSVMLASSAAFRWINPHLYSAMRV